MSPKQVKITPSSLGQRDPVVDAAHRDHAHRAAGAVDELDVRRQQVVDPVLVDRVRVAAADLHELVVAAGLDQRQDLAGDGAAELGVAELVDELHAAASDERGDRGAGVDEQPCRPARPASTSAISTVLAAPVVGGAQREPAIVVDPHARSSARRRRRR